MVEYNGEIFFAGMVRDKENDNLVISCVQKLNTNHLGGSMDASNVKFCYADGTEFTYEVKQVENNGTIYTVAESEYWRAYDIFVFKGELYVAHSNTSKNTVNTESGLFKYDKQNNRFVQVSKGSDIKGFMSVTRNINIPGYMNNEANEIVYGNIHYSFEDNIKKKETLMVGQEAIYSEPICGAKISTNDTFVAVCNGIFKSSDVITFEQVSLGNGYENYVTRDAFEKDGKYYFLASVKNGTHDFTTAVFETDGNFETFRRVLYFDTQSFARSFVYNEGYLYIGLGGNGRIDNIGDSVGSKYSGTLYRIDLAKLIPSDSEDEETKKEEPETPSTSEVTTEEKTETPSTSEVTTEEKTEMPSTSEVTTEEKTETPSTSEVTTEEKTEIPSTSEVTTEEKTETPSTSEETSEEEKTETPSTSEEASEEGKTETPEEGKQIGWVKDNGKWYYLNADGSKKTGWVQDGSKWYYLNANGIMQTGWVKDGGKWYYLNENGTMQTGWIKDAGKWYYLNANGSMQTGWIKDNGKWYYLNGSGDMAQGWIKVAAKWYYLGNSGDMVTGWLKQNNIWYYLSGNGDMLNGWQKIKGKWYYFYTSGKMASNTKIGAYYVNANGEWVK
ncbi:MAG: hypothetical protein IJA10_14620 [Lachnospiraceae bacterium]|nr:hypothetical protein [Lachnospiraceae bacterium]